MNNSDPAAWPIKIITLNGSDERRESLLRALQRYGLDYELVWGVDGRSKLDRIWETWIDRKRAERRLGRQMTDAEFGCALSHVKIYEEIANQDLPGAIVLEDDAIIGRLFAHFVSERLYAQHDLIQLDYWQAFTFSLAIANTRLSRQVAAERLVGNAFLTTGYTISRRASKYILENALPLSLPSDWPCDLRPMRPVISVPRVVLHPPHGSGSYIEESRAASRRRANSKRGKPLPNDVRNPRPWWFRYGRRLLARRASDDR